MAAIAIDIRSTSRDRGRRRWLLRLLAVCELMVVLNPAAHAALLADQGQQQ